MMKYRMHKSTGFIHGQRLMIVCIGAKRGISREVEVRIESTDRLNLLLFLCIVWMLLWMNLHAIPTGCYASG